MVFPHPTRRPITPHGSLSLAVSSRLGPGSTFTSPAIDATRDEIKTFGFRGNLRGSWFIDGKLSGASPFFTLFEGTFPASTGSLTSRSLTEAFSQVRGRVRLSAAGSMSMYYGGYKTGEELGK